MVSERYYGAKIVGGGIYYGTMIVGGLEILWCKVVDGWEILWYKGGLWVRNYGAKVVCAEKKFSFPMFYEEVFYLYPAKNRCFFHLTQISLI